jgi:hypothetical protein
MGLDPGNPVPVLVTVAPVNCAIPLCPGVSNTVEKVLLLQYAVSCCVVAYSIAGLPNVLWEQDVGGSNPLAPTKTQRNAELQ